MNSNKTFLIINQTAGSPYHGMVYRNYYIAREWVKEGHRAIIITSSYFHNFHTLPKTEKLFNFEIIDGIEYWWVRMPKYAQSKSFGRLTSIFLFAFLLIFFPIRKLKRPDTIIVSGPPHVPIINAWIWSRIFSSTLIYEVRDIWPLTIQKLGGLNWWHPVILILSLFEKLAYLLTDRVISVLAFGWKHFETRGMFPAKFAYIPNGIDLNSYDLVPSEIGQKVAEISKTKFTLIYAGSFGIANNIEQLIDAGNLLKRHEDLAIILIGDGPKKNKLIEMAGDNPAITFLPYVAKDQVPFILKQAHVGFVGSIKSDLYKFGISPNKVFDYMAAELPIIMAIDTDDDIVGKSQSGVTISSGEASDLAEAILKLKNLSKDELVLKGKNGRRYLEKNHTYESLAKKYLKVAEEGRRPVEESARWVASPFWIGFNIVIVLGVIAHFLFPAFAPHLFQDGMITFLKDPHTYQKIALRASEMPWSEFTFRPEGQFPAGILSLIYKLTGIHKPFMLLPLLAILAGLTIRGIASCLDVLGVRGRWWPLFIGVLFTVTPTSLSWMVYPHKDAFIVPGVILIAWTFMAVILRRIRLRHFFTLLLGSFLVFTSKPYFAELFVVGTLLAFPFAWRQPASKLGRYGRMAFFIFGLFVFGTIAFLKNGYTDAGEGVPLQNSATQIAPVDQSIPRHTQTKTNWKSIPGGVIINKALLALAFTRERFLFQRSHGNTNYLPEVHLEGAWDTIKFMPKALQLSLLEPLPWRQIQGGMARKLIFISVQLEMILVYLSLLFLIFAGRKRWNPAVMTCLALSIPFLLALGFAAPNIGAINRYRFPFLILIKIAGLAALWSSSRLKWPGRLLMWIDPPNIERKKKKVLFLVPDDVTFLVQRLVMAQGVQKAGYDVHVASEDTGVSHKVEELGFTFHRLDLHRGGMNPFADFKPFIKLVFFLAKERPDILQCVSIKPVIYGSTAGAIVGLKRIVCLVNGLGYAFEGKNVKGNIVQFIAKALYRNALALPGIRVIFQNPDDRDFFVESKLVDAGKTLLIRGSGVNMQKFAPSSQPNNPTPVVLYVGRLLWSKGIRELIEATRTLKNENIAFTLKVVGAPDEKNPKAVPRDYLEKLHQEGLIEWLGRQTDMPKFYKEADIVVLPTQYREGLPLTLLEASSTGRAIIATDAPGCREVIRDHVNGFKIPSKDAVALTNAMRTLILDPELRKQYGGAGSEIVRKEFSSDIVQKQLVNLYENLLTEKKRRTK